MRKENKTILKRRKKVIVSLLAVVLLLSATGTALAYIDTNYLWSQRFYTVYQGYNTAQRNHVRTVQQITSYYPGCSNLVIDGSFGDLTTDNVRIFQRARGLVEDGRVGPNTWYSMQLRTTYSRTASGNDYYKVKTTSSDAASSATYNYEHIRHLDDTNGTWQFRHLGGTWGTIR